MGDDEDELDVNELFDSLLGEPLSNSEDLQSFCNALNGRRKELVQLAPENDDYPIFLSQCVLRDPPPAKLVAKVQLWHKGANMMKGIGVDTKWSGAEMIKAVVEKCASMLDEEEGKHGWILKVPGRREYIDGPANCVEFECVRLSLIKKTPVILSLIARKPPRPKRVDTFKAIALAQSDPPKQPADPCLDEDDCTRLKVFPIWKVHNSFRVHVHSIDRVLPEGLLEKKLTDLKEGSANFLLFVEVELYHGNELMCAALSTDPVPFRYSKEWSVWLDTMINVSQIPKSARIGFTVWLRTAKKNIALGSVTSQLFDYESKLRQGKYALNLFPMTRASPLTSTASFVEFDEAEPPGVLNVEYDTYEMPVLGPSTGAYFYPNQGQLDGGSASEPTADERARIKQVCAKDPLYRPTKEEKALFWNYRNFLKSDANALPMFLKSVPWQITKARAECHVILDQWAPLPPQAALELLDGAFPDQKVREWALKCLDKISDTELTDFILPLCQVVKYEGYHDSALANWLLRRAVASPMIGHIVFWNMKSELHLESMRDRYGALVATYLFCCGPSRYALYKQNMVLEQLDDIANYIKTVPTADRLKALRDALKQVEFPERFTLPLDPRMECAGLNVEKCRYMDSKKLPLWLNFKNADPEQDSIIVIHKAGDDLRQDYLTLQLITIMDRLWQDNGLNMCMKPYKCVPTGDEKGMLQVVVNSDTISNIQKAAGGAMGAFKEDPVANWLAENRPAEVSEAEQIHNFVYSTAGYCVATYVLGIGDRHNDNIMVTKAGNFFHIDFGHFLGNIKKKFGVKRERAPFVFTPDLAYVMGGKDSANYRKFVELCCTCYQILRKNANMFITMFSMMISSGMPELTKEEDIRYLQEAFALDMTDAEAEAKMKKLISDALNSTATKLNFAIHILAH